jgi:uncharacterized glyoxalase superfamily protein PhnB
VGLCSTDVARSITLYQSLGFSEQYRNQRGVMMSFGSAILFIRNAANEPAAGEAGARSFVNAPGIDHISLAVTDVDALCSTFEAAGVPPDNQTWGARMAGLKDPGGNNLYLLQKLKAT